VFKIGKLFHLTHVVEDLDAVDRWYDEVFAVDRFYKGYEKAAKRHASLVVISDIVMEPVQLATEVEGAAESPIGKFRARYGQHFHSIAWYADDMEDAHARFDAAGFRLYDVKGRQVTTERPALAIWTHPKDTHALLEFAPTGDYARDPRLKPDWSDARWRTHPLGIERTSHVTVLFADLGDADAVYIDALDGRLIHEEDVAGRRRSRYYALGEDTIVEAAQPLAADSPEGRELDRYGEGVFEATFATTDLAGAAAFLEAKGQRVVADSDGAPKVVLEPDVAFGMRLVFSERRIPGDTR
jgi:catechol 2,3-dioxygenase-like lactoylglutathione lyase family enzyme